MKVRKIKSVVEMGRNTDVEYFDLPEGWDDLSEEEQDAWLTETALTHQNNVAPCGAVIVEVGE